MRFLFADRKGATAIWSVVNPIAQALVSNGHAVCFARLDDGAQRTPLPTAPDVEVFDIQVPRKTSPAGLVRQQAVFGRQFRELIRSCAPDVVHTHFCVPGVVARRIARAERVPAIVSTQHELYGSMHAHYRWALRLTEDSADAVVYVSQAVARSFGRSVVRLGTRPKFEQVPKHAVIYNGIDLERLGMLRRSAGAVEPGKIVCAGRLVPVKGQQLLVEALPSILELSPQARLVLAGSGPDEARLHASAARLRVADRVRFTGWLPHDDTLHEMATAAVVVTPSDGTQEGFGLVLLEAMALGAPVVASRIPVFEEIAGEQTDRVRFFKPGNRAAVAEAVTGMLGSGSAPDRCPPLERIATLFSVQRMVASYRALYEALCASRGVKARHPS